MQFLEALRSRLEEGNFKPFTIQLSDGRNLRVPHPDFIAVTSQLIVVVDEIGLRHPIDFDEIVDISDCWTYARQD